MTISEACIITLEEVAAEQSATSRHTYAWHARTLATEFGGDTDLAQITRMEVQGWVTRCRQRLKPASIRHQLSFLARLYRVATDHGLDLVDPTKGVRCPKVNNARRRILEESEEAALRGVCKPETFTIIEFAYHTGLRRLEQFRLQPADIRLWVERTHTMPSGEQIPIYHGLAQIKTSKTGEGRVCPLNPIAATIAHIWQQQDRKYLFGSQGENRLSVAASWCREKFRPACAAVGIEDLHWHDLRHTAATRAIRAGAKPEDVRQLLGHSSLSQTDRYITWGDSPAWAAALAIGRA